MTSSTLILHYPLMISIILKYFLFFCLFQTQNFPRCHTLVSFRFFLSKKSVLTGSSNPLTNILQFRDLPWTAKNFVYLFSKKSRISHRLTTQSKMFDFADCGRAENRINRKCHINDLQLRF
jgi:hypothetical protein